MAVKASVTITISCYRDTDTITRYYKLQASTAQTPAKPSTLIPSGWNDTEPSYTSGSTNTLYFVDRYIFSDGTFQYTEVSRSTSYEAAKEAYNKAQAAQDNLDNIKIGGRNLLQESTLTSQIHTDCNWSLGVMNSITSKTFTSDGLKVITPGNNTGANNNGATIILKNANDIIPAGTYVVFSIYIKGVAEYGHIKGFYQGTGQYFYSNSVVIVSDTSSTSDTEFKRYIGIFKMPDVGTLDKNFYINLGQGKVTNVVTRIYKNVKLEIGNKATDWTPALEDVDTSSVGGRNYAINSNFELGLLSKNTRRIWMVFY